MHRRRGLQQAFYDYARAQLQDATKHENWRNIELKRESKLYAARPCHRATDLTFTSTSFIIIATVGCLTRKTGSELQISRTSMWIARIRQFDSIADTHSPVQEGIRSPSQSWQAYTFSFLKFKSSKRQIHQSDQLYYSVYHEYSDEMSNLSFDQFI